MIVTIKTKFNEDMKLIMSNDQARNLIRDFKRQDQPLILVQKFKIFNMFDDIEIDSMLIKTDDVSCILFSEEENDIQT